MMKRFAATCLSVFAAAWLAAQAPQAGTPDAPSGHPDASVWPALFAENLSNAEAPAGVWTFEDGLLTASEDQCLWTREEYENFVLDLEFMTAPGTNSGVIVYATDTGNWIPHSVEIQIADDFAEQWSRAPKNWQCGAVFGHLAPSRSAVKKPGEWNRMTLFCRGKSIRVVLNGGTVADMDMALWTSAEKNPDGSEIPAWLSTPFAGLATRGRIGLQGKHAGAPVYFRRLRILAGPKG